jgi:hypothetical protein
MDYTTNQKFFDAKHNKKVKILKRIGMPITVIGGILMAISSIPGLGLYVLMYFCWFPLIIGVPILAVSYSLRVKESDMLDLIENQKREFKLDAEEKLDYPNDLSSASILLVGCEKDPESLSKKLKLGVTLYPRVTLTHLYIKKDRVTAQTRTFSLCDDGVENKMVEVAFSEFDAVKVVDVSEGDHKGCAFRLLCGEDVVFSAPVFADDYTLDQFADSVLHAKSRRR